MLDSHTVRILAPPRMSRSHGPEPTHSDWRRIRRLKSEFILSIENRFSSRQRRTELKNVGSIALIHSPNVCFGKLVQGLFRVSFLRHGRSLVTTGRRRNSPPSHPIDSGENWLTSSHGAGDRSWPFPAAGASARGGVPRRRMESGSGAQTAPEGTNFTQKFLTYCCRAMLQRFRRDAIPLSPELTQWGTRAERGGPHNRKVRNRPEHVGQRKDGVAATRDAFRDRLDDISVAGAMARSATSNPAPG